MQEIRGITSRNSTIKADRNIRNGDFNILEKNNYVFKNNYL